MRPTPIPDDAIWEGAKRAIFGPPDGDLTNPDIAPVEVLLDATDTCPRRISVRCSLEPGDLEKLQTGGHVWISFYGVLIPFSVDVTDGAGQ